MADLLSIGASALRAAQLTLDTTGNNIANAATEGYSRQRVDLATLPAQGAGSRFVGSGVTATGISRSYSQFARNEVLNYSTSSGRYQAYSELSLRMDRLLGTSGAALNEALGSVFNAIQDMANSPTSIAEREVVLAELQSLAARQGSVFQGFDDLNSEISARIQAAVDEVNSLASGIAKLNDSIVVASAGGGTPNDLLDKRDGLIQELSGLVSVTLTEQDDGAINLFVGGAQALVVGSRTEQLAAVADPYDASRLNVGVPGGVSINGEISGGALRGLLDVRAEVLDPALEELGLLSLGITETLNAQQRLGTDLNGNLGTDLLAQISIPVAGNTLNAGSATPTVNIVDADQLQSDSYRLDFAAGNWTLTRLSDSQSISGAGPLQMDGLNVDVSAGVPANNDSFLIRPGRAGAAGFAAIASDPRALAAASPLRAEASLGNSGSAAIAAPEIADTIDLPLAGTVTMTFNPDALGPGVPGYDVTGAITTTVAYDPATDADGISVSLGLTGVSFTLSGVPAAGDVISINNTGSGSGDNSNALALGALRDQSRLEGGTASFQDVYSGLLSGVATRTAQAEAGLEVEAALLVQAEETRSSISGVNLDEEAANLLRFQQQYQAAAQIIATADQVFNSLLNATRR